MTAALGVLGVDYLLIPPLASFSLTSPADIVPATIFFGLAALLSHADASLMFLGS